MARAFIFPGQGSQAVGMGRALAEAFPVARATFDEVDDALNEKLSLVMWEGPMEALSRTANTQPALMAHSIAAMRVLEAEAGVDLSSAAFVAGHSLGEYSALCAAGALSLAETARLLRLRGDAMQAAVPEGNGAMAALLAADEQKTNAAIAAAAGAGVVEIANDNAPGQIVVSGARGRIETLAADVRTHGIKMAKILPVSAPFHCSMMGPAADAMAGALEEADISAPIVPVVANVTAAPTRDPGEIKKLLVDQVTGRVRWRESVEAMSAAGVRQFTEVGSGKILVGLVKRIAPDAELSWFGDPGDMDAIVGTG